MNPFLSACGANGPLQLSVECREIPEAECQTFDIPSVLIGRDPIADLHFNHADVDDRHAYLQLVEGRLFCADLGSRRGTYLTGKRHRSGWVNRRETIRIGPYRIKLVASEGEAPRELARSRVAADVSSPSPRLVLELSHRTLRPTQCEVHHDLVLIGSAEDCHVRLLDPRVSNYHCSLLLTSSGPWIVDLLGEGGISINGALIRRRQVNDGDVLLLGHSRIRFRLCYALEGGGAPPALIFRPGPNVTMASQDLPGRKSELVPIASPISREAWAQVDVESGVPGAPALAPALVTELGGCLTRLEPEQARLVEAIVVPLVDQFNLMQQQLVDRFHQAGMMLFETFSNLNEEHVTMFRGELVNLSRITRELEAVRGELEGLSPTSPLPPNHLGPAARATSRVLLGRVNGSGDDGHEGAATPAQDFGAVRNQVAEAVSTLDVGEPLEIQAEAERADPPTAVNDVVASSITMSPASSGRVNAPVDGGKRNLESGRKIDADMHALLYQRITSLQVEQRGYWQKVLGLIPSHTQRRPTP